MKQTIDWGLSDYRVTLQYADMEPYLMGSREYLAHVICPLDLYEEGMRSDFYGKIIRNPRTEPLCGRVDFDDVGSIQGNWRLANPEGPSSWEDDLAFIPGHTDPDKLYISIGGTITPPLRWQVMFPSYTMGNYEVAFDHVIHPGMIFCYDYLGPGRILVQYTDSAKTQIRVEHQDMECGDAPLSFYNPTVYKR